MSINATHSSNISRHYVPALSPRLAGLLKRFRRRNQEQGPGICLHNEHTNDLQHFSLAFCSLIGGIIMMPPPRRRWGGRRERVSPCGDYVLTLNAPLIHDSCLEWLTSSAISISITNSTTTFTSTSISISMPRWSWWSDWRAPFPAEAFHSILQKACPSLGAPLTLTTWQ